MNISDEIKQAIIREFPATRGRNDYQFFIIPASSAAPYTSRTAGYTEWKNGTPRKYHRAEYKINVGELWIKSKWPASYICAMLANEPMVFVRADFAGPKEPFSLDPEEDERIYA